MSIDPLLLPVWIMYLQPIVSFFSNLVITPKPFPTDRIFDGSKEVEIWECKMWAVWWVAKNRSSVWWLLPMFSHLFLRNISVLFLWCRTLLKQLCKVLRVWVYRSKVMVWPRGIMSVRITSSAVISGFRLEVEVRRSHHFCLL